VNPTEPIARDAQLSIRRLQDTPEDLELMAGWLTDPRVLEFYSGRDQPRPMDVVAPKYGRRARGEEPVVPCLMEWEGRPVGYLQYYRVADQPDDGRNELMDDVDGVFAIDMFIGEPELWNRGLGSRAIRLLSDHLFERAGATRVTVDPRTTNDRAIRSYEKAGFRKVGVLPRNELHEGVYHDAWLMVAEPERPPLGNRER
jgi:aminoglycoside 6'-N-acetyltransferase